MDDTCTSLPIQRRNLLIISCLVLFFEIGGISITSQDTIRTGLIDVNVAYTDIINISLNAALIYFFWRYLNSFILEKRHTLICSEISISICDAMREQAHKIAAKRKPEDPFNKPPGQVYINLLNNALGYEATPLKKISKDNVKNLIRFGGEYIFSYTGSAGPIGDITTVVINCCLLEKTKIRVYIKKLFLEKIFLQYYLPFIMFLLALLETVDIRFASYLVRPMNW